MKGYKVDCEIAITGGKIKEGEEAGYEHVWEKLWHSRLNFDIS